MVIKWDRERKRKEEGKKKKDEDVSPGVGGIISPPEGEHFSSLRYRHSCAFASTTWSLILDRIRQKLISFALTHPLSPLNFTPLRFSLTLVLLSRVQNRLQLALQKGLEAMIVFLRQSHDGRASETSTFLGREEWAYKGRNRSGRRDPLPGMDSATGIVCL